MTMQPRTGEFSARSAALDGLLIPLGIIFFAGGRDRVFGSFGHECAPAMVIQSWKTRNRG